MDPKYDWLDYRKSNGLKYQLSIFKFFLLQKITVYYFFRYCRTIVLLDLLKTNHHKTMKLWKSGQQLYALISYDVPFLTVYDALILMLD